MLRRYLLDEDAVDAFLVWWQAGIPALREKEGFTIEWAYLDRDNATFTWAISHSGDRSAFDEAEARYLALPDRAATIATAPPLKEMSVGYVERVR